MCDKCKVIRRHGKVMVICSKNPSHKHIKLDFAVKVAFRLDIFVDISTERVLLFAGEKTNAKKKITKNIDKGCVHIHASFNNTIVAKRR